MHPLEQNLRYFELLRDKVVDWTSYPFSIPAVSQLDRLDFDPAVTFFVGENGAGKSTLIEAIAALAGFSSSGGTKNFTQAGRPSVASLHAVSRLVRGARRERSGFFLRAETMFDVASEARQYEWDDLHAKSHGEAFMWVALNRFFPGGLFILDEPEAALSPSRQLALLARMHQLVEARSQFVVSTHSPILMAYPGARIYLLDADGIRQVRYEETEHYAVTRTFLQDPAGMLRKIWNDADEGEK